MHVDEPFRTNVELFCRCVIVPAQCWTSAQWRNTNSNPMSTICFADRPIALHEPRGEAPRFATALKQFWRLAILSPITCISRIFYIGDLRSGQFCGLSIISQWRNIEIHPIKKYASENHYYFRMPSKKHQKALETLFRRHVLRFHLRSTV